MPVVPRRRLVSVFRWRRLRRGFIRRQQRMPVLFAALTLVSAGNVPHNVTTMADRTSASLFGTVFKLLAENPTDEHKTMAGKLWPLTRDYDFSPYQMYCDEALITLGLARMGINPEWPEDGEVVLYGVEQ